MHKNMKDFCFKCVKWDECKDECLFGAEWWNKHYQIPIGQLTEERIKKDELKHYKQIQPVWTGAFYK